MVARPLEEVDFDFLWRTTRFDSCINQARILVRKDIRPSSRDHKIGKLHASWYKLVIRDAQGVLVQRKFALMLARQLTG